MKQESSAFRYGECQKKKDFIIVEPVIYEIDTNINKSDDNSSDGSHIYDADGNEEL